MRPLVLVHCPRRRWRALPVREVAWLDERPRDRCGRLRSPVTLPGYRKGRKPANAGRRFPADPPTTDEILRLLAACPDTAYGRRNRALIVLLWRSGLRISEALALEPRDLNPTVGSVFVRSGKGSKAGVSGMDAQAFAEIQPWIEERQASYKPGPLFCVVEGPTAGERMRSAYVRTMLKGLAEAAGVDRRVNPHSFRHRLAVDLARELPIPLVSRQLRHANIATTATYLASISNQEAVDAVFARVWPA